MRRYLRILFSTIFITGLASITAEAAGTAQVAPTPAAAAPAPAQQQASPPARPVTTTAPPAQNSSADQTAPKAPASTYFNYAHDEAEYSVMLPEAPTVKTLWTTSPEVTDYMDNPPKDGASLGEIATFKRVDMDTDETFEVKITFLKARKSFLEELNGEKIQDILTKQYTGVTLSNQEFKISGANGPLKWAVLSGFTLDPHQHPAFYSINYLTGLQSILVVEVSYSLENKVFQGYYDNMINGINYIAP